MKKYAAVAVVAVMLGVAGCAQVGHTQGPPISATPAPATVNDQEIGSRDDLVREVQSGWVGPDMPNAYWIRTEAMLICKQAIGGNEPRVHLEGVDAEENSTLMVDGAREHVCPAPTSRG